MPANPGAGGSIAPGRQQRKRLITDPKPLTAFAVGFGLFFFSIAFMAAVQVIETARAGAVVAIDGAVGLS